MSTSRDDCPDDADATPETPQEEKHVAQQRGVPSVNGGVAPFIQRNQLQHLPPRGLSVEHCMMSMRIPDHRQAQVHAMETHGNDSLEHKIVKCLHCKAVQTILASLLFLDVLIIFSELTLWTMYPHCSIIQRDGISCCPAATDVHAAADDAAAVAEEEDHGGAQGGRYLLFLERFLSGDATAEESSTAHHQDFCASGLEASFDYAIGCDEHKWYRVHTAERVLFGFTMTILSIFMLELTVLMIAIRPWIFFRHFFYVLDFVVVSGSIVLESIFHTMGNDIAQTFAGFLIVLRLWRFVRIGHGITEIISEVSNEKYQHLLAYTEELECILKKNHLKLPDAGSIRHVETRDIVDSIKQHERKKLREERLKRVDEEEE